MTVSALSDPRLGARSPRRTSPFLRWTLPCSLFPLLAATACGGAREPAVTPVEAAEEVAEALGDAAPYEAPVDEDASPTPDGGASPKEQPSQGHEPSTATRPPRPADAHGAGADAVRAQPPSTH